MSHEANGGGQSSNFCNQSAGAETNSIECQQIIVKRMINELWNNIKIVRQLYMDDNGDTSKMIIAMVRENEEKVSSEYAATIVETFKENFNFANLRTYRDIRVKFSTEIDQWLSLLSIVESNLCNCFMSPLQKYYKEVVAFFSLDTLKPEIIEQKFDPKDFLAFSEEISSKLCCEARDVLVSDLKREISDLPRISAFEQQNKENLTEYGSKLQKCIEQLLKALILMQGDISCYTYEEASAISQKSGEAKEKLLVASERNNFSKIIQMSKHLRNLPMDGRQAIFLPQTTSWLARNGNDCARAWAELLMFESHELPEILISSQDSLTYLASFFNNFVIISCLSTFVESEFKKKNVPYTPERQFQLMKSVRRVMIASQTNCMLFELEHVVNNYFPEVKSDLGVESLESMVSQVKSVCNPKGSLHKLSKERMQTYLTKILAQPNLTELSDEKIIELLPKQFKLLTKNIVCIVKEAIELMDLNLKIYNRYYDQHAELSATKNSNGDEGLP